LLHRNISIALHQGVLYMVQHKTAVALPVRMTAAGRLSLGMDRLWAQIRAMPDHRPQRTIP
jgi:hypothetical protein